MSGGTNVATGSGSLWIPDHLSQKHQLKPDGSTGADWPELWGRDYSGLNCAYTIGAMAGRFATRGAWMPTPNEIRELAKDREGGAFPADIGRAVIASGKVPARLVNVPRGGLSWNAIAALRARGYFVAMAVDYELITDPPSCQPTFDGSHMFGLPPVPPKPTGELPADDPLCNNRKSYSPAMLRAAARKCADSFGSPGLMVAVFGQDPAVVVDPRDARIRALELELEAANGRLLAISKLASVATTDPGAPEATE